MTDIPIRYVATDNTKAASASARKNVESVAKGASSASGELQKASSGAQKAMQMLGGEIGKASLSIPTFNAGMLAVAGAAGAAATAVVGIGKSLFAMSQEAQAFGTIKSSMDGLAASFGASSDAMLRSLQRASRGMISQHDLVLAANRAMLLGVADTEAEMGQLMEVAIARGRAMGLSATQAFNDLVTGLGRMSPMILDNLGIVTGGEKVFTDYAESIGKVADELTDAERKQALFTAVVSSSAGIVADQANANVDAAATMASAWADLRLVIGELASPAAIGALTALTGALRGVVGAAEAVADASTPATLSERAQEQAALMAEVAAAQKRMSQATQEELTNAANAAYMMQRGMGDFTSSLTDSTRQLVFDLIFLGDAMDRIQSVSEKMAPLEWSAGEDVRLQSMIERANEYKAKLEEVTAASAAVMAASAAADAERAANMERLSKMVNDMANSLLPDLGPRVYGNLIEWNERYRVQLEALMQYDGYTLEQAFAIVGVRIQEDIERLVEMNEAAQNVEETAARIARAFGVAVASGIDNASGAVVALWANARGALADIAGLLDLSGLGRGISTGIGKGGNPMRPRETQKGGKNEGRGFGERTFGLDTKRDVELAQIARTRELEKATKAQAEAARGATVALKSLEGMLAGVPGLFGTTSVTAEDMAAAEAGTYKNKADEYLRRLRDEVINGIDHEGVSIEDAAAALGIDGALAAEEVLRQFEAAWNDSSLFANAANLKFINMDAVQAHIEQELAKADGEKNLKALFGIGDAADVAAVAALGLDIQSGLAAWLSENGFDDAGSALATALGSGVKDAGGELGSGVSDGLGGWLSSDEGASQVKDFAERLGVEISKNLNITPNMNEPPPTGGAPPPAGAWDAGGSSTPSSGGNSTVGGSASAYGATTININTRLDAVRFAEDLARRNRRR